MRSIARSRRSVASRNGLSWAGAAAEAPPAPVEPAAAVIADQDSDTDEMEAYVDELPEDALNLDIDRDTEDLALLDMDESEFDEIELDDSVEAGGGDEELDLTEEIDPEAPNQALIDTEPKMSKEDLFEEPGTDLSSLDGGDPEETS